MEEEGGKGGEDRRREVKGLAEGRGRWWKGCKGVGGREGERKGASLTDKEMAEKPNFAHFSFAKENVYLNIAMTK